MCGSIGVRTRLRTGHRDMRISLGVLVALLLNGCATSQTAFIEKGQSLDDLDVCQNYLADKLDVYQSGQETKKKTRTYLASLQREFFARGLTEAKCSEITKSHNQRIMGAVAAGVVVGAVAYKIVKDDKACKKNPAKCKNKSSGSYRKKGFAWDYFCDNSGKEQRRCRDVGNGNFAKNSQCSHSPSNDDAWPTQKKCNAMSDFSEPLSGYAWDYFYDDYGNEQRRCRNVARGKFAQSSRCFLSPSNDNIWPDK